MSSIPEDMGIYGDASVGVDHLWANKFDAAESVFSANKATSPRSAILYAEVGFYKAIVSEAAHDRKIAIDRFEAAIALGNEHVSVYNAGKLPKGVVAAEDQVLSYATDAHIVVADGYVQIAMLLFLEEQRIKGLLSMRRAWRTYRDILAYALPDPPTIADDGTTTHDDVSKGKSVDADVISSLKFGAGMFYFIISLIPPGIAQKAAMLAGFHGGDKRKGLTYLRECYESRSIRSNVAGLVLALNYLFLTIPFDEDAAPSLLREVDDMVNEGVRKYPTGSLFHAFGCVAALDRGRTEDALTFATAAMTNIRDVVTNPPIFVRMIVNCHLMRQDWNAAIQTITALMEHERVSKSKYNWSKTWNYLRLAACHAVQGDFDKAKSCFSSAAKQRAHDAWTNHLKHQALKFSRMHPQFAVYEIMTLTNHYNKLIQNASDEKRRALIAELDGFAQKASGALQPLSGVKKREKGMFSMFSRKEYTNDPHVDNRACYLTLKSLVQLETKELSECKANVQEIITNNHLLAHDKLYYVLALITHARVTVAMKGDVSEALESLKLAQRQTGFVWENSIKGHIKRLLEKYGVADEVMDAAGATTQELSEDEVALMVAQEEADEKAEEAQYAEEEP